MPSVLVTGANRGLGLAFVESFAADGWRVHACCRHPEKCRPLQDLGEGVALHRLDVTEGLQVEALARNLADEPLDLLINNAGLGGEDEDLESLDFELWQRLLAVNVLAPARLAAAFWPAVVASSRRVIVNVSSKMGSIADNGSGGAYAYRSSKAALNMVTRNLAIELKDKGAVVVAVHPGWVRTEMGGPEAEITPEESVGGLRRLIDGLTPADSGRFFDWQGRELPW
ncbi:NAD(P)-dependent dehydrogenase, short-chain alcohol dehydrogenase family [Tistlia consotensis]|uniref:NAD(P)-dependent dehydrogenase, short-chain alcohol dehydrogenase family n=1 Tax=Tistlia consotensis USBA 355 TaxID=560819 RepID=A0A1Y6CCR2_9PROT|nr:SDR family oxidoreductase [Tistlia consotensis]SMF48073.1 NAD(P)-dependent dehydrogenase, short-chain alcohol dehydrogenase family [Tistlia consotensis USBA 355]SNR81910.1 NAD(P)-dependent dehydrogenase, short-chain alcohol dehydrogenase family [Tistlia consotensis]